MAIALAVVSCRGRPADPPAAAPAQQDALAGFSLDRQQLGSPADGLSLRSIRHAAHDGYYRLVFDIGMVEGQLATSVPSAEASYRERDRSIELTVGGIRHDLTGNLPLHAESGEALGRAVPIDRPPISHYGRELVLDDSAVVYRIKLTRQARFRLHALDDPARIIVDIEDTGGARPR